MPCTHPQQERGAVAHPAAGQPALRRHLHRKAGVRGQGGGVGRHAAPPGSGQGAIVVPRQVGPPVQGVRAAGGCTTALSDLTRQLADLSPTTPPDPPAGHRSVGPDPPPLDPPAGHSRATPALIPRVQLRRDMFVGLLPMLPMATFVVGSPATQLTHFLPATGRATGVSRVCGPAEAVQDRHLALGLGRVEPQGARVQAVIGGRRRGL